jgi:hypothetical protein
LEAWLLFLVGQRSGKFLGWDGGAGLLEGLHHAEVHRLVAELFVQGIAGDAGAGPEVFGRVGFEEAGAAGGRELYVDAGIAVDGFVADPGDLVGLVG